MSEGRTTATFCGVALVLALGVWATAPRTTLATEFAERGQLLFPEFRDPNTASALEITQFDPASATVQPFKVQNRQGHWTIPSQYDYPADARDRLAATAAAIVALRKDEIASDNAADYERCGVLDPLSTLPNVNGRGARVLFRGTHDEVLADIILGRRVESHPELRYVRLPTERRIYVSKVGDLNISTAFGDWIDRDLLQLTPDEIAAVNLRNYALDRTTGKVNPGETLLLRRGPGNRWTLNDLGSDEHINPEALGGLLDNLATLRIAGVLPKPAGITATLRQEVSRTAIAPEDRADLSRKGFYLSGNGQLVSNRGEVVVLTKRGVYYTLRFGDIAPTRDVVPADVRPSRGEDVAAVARESRFLFIMVDFDASAAETPGRASEGAERAQLLRARFAPWYYVIAADSFAALRLGRHELVGRAGAAH